MESGRAASVKTAPSCGARSTGADLEDLAPDYWLEKPQDLRELYDHEPKFAPFELERWQSTWENRVRFNLSSPAASAINPELLGLAVRLRPPLLDVRLGYAQSNAPDLLRERIAALYPGASPDQILVTTGSSEANFLDCCA